MISIHRYSYDIYIVIQLLHHNVHRIDCFHAKKCSPRTLFGPFVMCVRPVALTERGSYPRSQVGRTKTGTQSHSLPALFSFCFSSLPTCAASFLSSAFSPEQRGWTSEKGRLGGRAHCHQGWRLCVEGTGLYARPIWELSRQQVWRDNWWFLGIKSCWLPHWVLFRLF